MTRFARAKGSKASNERLPEEATPWSELKQQLLEKNKEIEENKKRQDALDKRSANYKAFLEEKEKENDKNSSWSEFPNAENSTVKKSKKKNDKKISTQEISKLDPAIIPITTESDNDEPPEEHSSKKEIVEPIVAKKRKLKVKKHLKITVENENTEVNNEEYGKKKPAKKRKTSENDEDTNKKLKKDNKSNAALDKNQQKKKIVKENLTEKDLRLIEKKKIRRLKQVEKKKLLKAELKQQKIGETKVEENGNTINEGQTKPSGPIAPFDKYSNKNTFPKKPFNKSNKFMDRKSKVRDNEEHPRKKPLLPHKMFINGKELEVDYVDGFPVKKEDALRLKKLRKEMISKGLPRSEINIALKLERRKAEKAFAREKKKVCFHCRQSGHNLSECRNIGKNELAQTTATGICFKCGSTEHTHYECKVVRTQEFKYATCFICKEQGHISRQCPDNARGLYPKGGACKVCGDVTHLKKDCPKYQAQQQKQEETMRIETVGGNNPDVLEEKSAVTERFISNKRPNKVIKF